MYRDGYTLGTSLFLIVKNLDFIGVLIGGASRDRTDDLIVANDAVTGSSGLQFQSHRGVRGGKWHRSFGTYLQRAEARRVRLTPMASVYSPT
jgi:hypothetical protein